MTYVPNRLAARGATKGNAVLRTALTRLCPRGPGCRGRGRVAALEPHHSLAMRREPGHEGIDLILVAGGAEPGFADQELAMVIVLLLGHDHALEKAPPAAAPPV